MKKIKNKYHLLVNSLLTTLLGLFAASCDRGGSMVCMYGPMPVDDMAVYKVTGQITDEQNQPLDSMRVHFYLDQFVRTDDFHSDSIGEYNAELWTWKGADTLHLVVYDPKKEYASDTTRIAISDMKLTPHEELSCSYSVELDIQLKKK